MTVQIKKQYQGVKPKVETASIEAWPFPAEVIAAAAKKRNALGIATKAQAQVEEKTKGKTQNKTLAQLMSEEE